MNTFFSFIYYSARLSLLIVVSFLLLFYVTRQ